MKLVALLLTSSGLLAAPAAREGLRPTHRSEICVYGGTAAGVMAAVQARRMGRTAVLVEPGRHLGGLTSGGLGATDVGRSSAIGGLSREFYDRVLAHYTSTYGPDSEQARACHGGFRFEPHVAEAILNELVREAQVPVYLDQRLIRAARRVEGIWYLETSAGDVFEAAMFIDATYEGDLLAAAGVSYTVGRESNETYGETLNGVQLGRPYHNFKVPVDPYVVPGDPSSGLLLGISPDPPGENGTGDRRIQAYNFRMCLSSDPDNQLPFPQPEGYDPERYTLFARYLQAGVWDALRLSTPMPNHKTDTNNHGGFSTDNIGMNYGWPEGDYAARQRIFGEHVTYQQGLMWFLRHDERVPSEIRDEVSRWGLPKDEFVDTGGWPFQLYVREARRMVSEVVMSEHHCRGQEVADDGVGLASYGMDSHHVRRIVVDGSACNEGDVEVGVAGPYPVSYRAIVPRRGECGNLLVPVCLSASHIAYGSIRMEPVFMVLAQSAATAACLAIDHGLPVQEVDYAELRERLLADGQVLEAAKAASVAAPIEPKSLPGVVLDDADGVKVGEWIASTIPQFRLVGTGYLHDGNTNKGAVSIAYTPDLPSAGRYEIVLFSPPNDNRATNVPVTIAVAGREAVQLTVDQRNAGTGGKASLGVFDLPAGKATTVSVSNAGTNGYLVADGIQFLNP